MTESDTRQHFNVISQYIKTTSTQVYEYVRDPYKLSTWAQGLSQAEIKKVQTDVYEVHSPMGVVQMKFAADNEYGIMDHDVILPDGSVSHNYFRVIPKGKDAIVMFTIIKPDNMNACEYEQDCQQIKADLEALRNILES